MTVTTSDNREPENQHDIVGHIEHFLNRYMDFPETHYALPIALWIIGTHCFEDFDAYPYQCITAATKQAGKTRLAELESFIVNNPLFTTGATAQSIFTRLDITAEARESGETRPTIFMDEAEDRSNRSAGVMDQFLNSGYRRGQSVVRVRGSYPTYCPKVFILIGDTHDTLRDRSIIFTLRRGTPKEDFRWSRVETEGSELRESITAELAIHGEAIKNAFDNGLAWNMTFLPGREREIWLPLFCIASILCPERLEELSRAAVDLATDKTGERRRYVNLAEEEDRALDNQYAERLLLDVHSVLMLRGTLPSLTLIEALKELPTAPWRKFKGNGGLDRFQLANMLSRFGVAPKKIRFGKRSDPVSKTHKGYAYAEVQAAMDRHQGGKTK